VYQVLHYKWRTNNFFQNEARSVDRPIATAFFNTILKIFQSGIQL